MGHNRTVYVVCDLCGHLPEFPPGSKWSIGAKVIGGCLVFVVYMAVSLGLGSVKNKKANTTGWTKNGMIKINGGSNWIHFAMVPPPTIT